MRIVIDTAAISYSIRRWFWLKLWYFDPMAAKMAAWCRRVKRCMGCGIKLTKEEHEYLGHSCNDCEMRLSYDFDDTEGAAFVQDARTDER